MTIACRLGFHKWRPIPSPADVEDYGYPIATQYKCAECGRCQTCGERHAARTP